MTGHLNLYGVYVPLLLVPMLAAYLLKGLLGMVLEHLASIAGSGIRRCSTSPCTFCCWAPCPTSCPGCES
ncbi:hypothetical protein BAY1663_00861 [Pseudomonas sp. BAY1663]|nr:hypothetical protein BAY1663_00861 [Pseudomonas sp. BAY1663]